MSKIVIVKPKAGKRVLDPATIPPSPLPEKGKRVVEDSYWLRRELAGEVEISPVASEADAVTATEAAPGKAKAARE